MNLTLTISDLFSISVISLLLTLLIYHFFIYWGRNGTDRIYYIYFSLFAFNFAIYLLCVTNLNRFVFSTSEIQHRISPAITGMTYFMLLHFALKMFTIILDFPKRKTKLLRPFYYSFTLYGLLVLTYVVLDYEVYMNHIFPIVVIFATFSPVYMFVAFTIHIIKQKLGNASHKIILAGFFIFMLDFALEEILSIVNIEYPLKGSYFISGVSALLWAFALAIRFNNEYKELQTLKQSLETKVTERTKELENAIEQRTNTFVNLAHEVKTPLTLVSNYIDEQINNHGSTNELEIMKENTDKLVRDISNFFVEEKFRKGTINYDHTQVVDLSDFLEKTTKLFSAYIHNKNLTLDTLIEPKIYIKADPEALSSLVNNLVENAIKYTPVEGLITIKLHEAEKKAVLIIKDNGKGIPKECQEKIYEPYYQVTEKKHNFQGIGMGLSIVHSIVNTLQGSIKLISRENIGTKFIIEIPSYHLSGGEKIINYENKQPVIGSYHQVVDIIDKEKKHTVLVVEDNMQMLQYLADNLKKHFSVYVAEDGRKAINKLKVIPRPNLIISDIMMDNMDGFEFFSTITTNGYSSVPLIFLTAKTTEEAKMKGLTMGAIDYIHKPFKISELIGKAIAITKQEEHQKNELVGSVYRFLQHQAEVPKVDTEVLTEKFEYNCYTYNISAREKVIIKSLSEGLTYKEIADVCFISENTVAKHIQHIYEKTGTKNKVELLGKLNCINK